MRGPFARRPEYKKLLAREHFDASTLIGRCFFIARKPSGGEETALVTVIIQEMGRGNFSFLILVVGLLQLIVMLKKKH